MEKARIGGKDNAERSRHMKHREGPLFLALSEARPSLCHWNSTRWPWVLVTHLYSLSKLLWLVSVAMEVSWLTPGPWALPSSRFSASVRLCSSWSYKKKKKKNVYSFPFSSGRLESVLVLYCGGRRKRLGAEKAFYPTIDWVPTSSWACSEHLTRISFTVTIMIGSLFHRWRGWGSERLRDLVSVTQLRRVDSWDPLLKFMFLTSLPSYLGPLDGIFPLSCSEILDKPLILP